MKKSTKIILAVICLVILNVMFGQLWLDMINDERVSNTLAWMATIILVAMNVGCIMGAAQSINKDS